MDLNLMAALGKFGPQQISLKKEIPAALQKTVEEQTKARIAKEKESYHNDLIPFEQHAAQIKETIKAECSSLLRQIQDAQKILKEQFKAQDASHTPVPENSSFSLFEEAIAALSAQVRASEAALDVSLTLKEQLKLPWTFMDRCYAIGKTFLQEKKFEEAKAVFFFLHDLEPNVLDYWYGEAMSQEGLSLYPDAIDTYCAALLIQPDNPETYFHVARCFVHINRYDSCINMLKMCTQYASEPQQEKDYTSLMKKAEELQKLAQKRKGS